MHCKCQGRIYNRGNQGSCLGAENFLFNKIWLPTNSEKFVIFPKCSYFCECQIVSALQTITLNKSIAQIKGILIGLLERGRKLTCGITQSWTQLTSDSTRLVKAYMVKAVCDLVCALDFEAWAHYVPNVAVRQVYSSCRHDMVEFIRQDPLAIALLLQDQGVTKLQPFRKNVYSLWCLFVWNQYFQT